MSSTSTESIENKEMMAIIRSLIKDSHHLSTLTNESQFGFSNAKTTYKRAYEFGRRTYLLPDYRQLLADEDKTNLKKYFPAGFAKLADYTPGLVNTLSRSTINTARERPSQIAFAREELLNLYQEVNDDQLPDEVVKASKTLNECEIDDDPDEVPNLNGVPETHDWWTEEYRELWANRQD